MDQFPLGKGKSVCSMPALCFPSWLLLLLIVQQKLPHLRLQIVSLTCSQSSVELVMRWNVLAKTSHTALVTHF